MRNSTPPTQEKIRFYAARVLGELRTELRGNLEGRANGLRSVHAAYTTEAVRKSGMGSGANILRTQLEIANGLHCLCRETLGAVERALERIGLNTYGICVVCGGKISDKRLKAIPYAERCIDCANGSIARHRWAHARPLQSKRAGTTIFKSSKNTKTTSRGFVF